jgi:hypothetical protein
VAALLAGLLLAALLSALTARILLLLTRFLLAALLAALLTPLLPALILIHIRHWERPPYRGMTPQSGNEARPCWFRKRRARGTCAI